MQGGRHSAMWGFASMLMLVIAVASSKNDIASAHSAPSTVYSCPCSLDVAVRIDAPALHIYVIPRSVGLWPFSYKLESQSFEEAERRNSTTRHHRVRITHFGRYELAVRIAGASETQSRFGVGVDSINEDDVCPNYLMTAPTFSIIGSSGFTDRLMRPWESSNPPRSRSSVRITGGDSGNYRLERYLVSVYHKETQDVICTGTLIASDLVVTAAHCVEDRLFQYIFYVGGNPSQGQRVSVDYVEYRDKNSINVEVSFDIALVHLREPVSYYYRPMKVNNNSAYPPLYGIVRTAGYGLDDSTKSFHKQLRTVDLPTYPEKECQELWSRDEVSFKSDSVICAGYKEGGCGPSAQSKGDGGGPLFHYDEVGDPVLLGVASFAMHCDSDTCPSAYVRISTHLRYFGLHRTSNMSNSGDFEIMSKHDFERKFGKSGVETRTIVIIVCTIVGAIGLLVVIIILGCFYRRRRVRREKRKIKEAVPPLPAAAAIGPVLPANGKKIDLDPPDTPPPRAGSNTKQITPGEDLGIPEVEIRRVDMSEPNPGSEALDYQQSPILSHYPEILQQNKENPPPAEMPTPPLYTDKTEVPSMPHPTTTPAYNSIGEAPTQPPFTAYDELMSSNYVGARENNH